MFNFNKVAVFVLIFSFSLVAVLFVLNIFNINLPVSVNLHNRVSELSVVGEGKVEVVPDVAYVSVGVTVDKAATVDQVQVRLNEINNRIITAMKSLGIDKKNIETSGYTISPNYDYNDRNSNINGYSGNASLQVKVEKIDMVSRVMNEATKAGANWVNSTGFEVSKPEKYREEARNRAIENAKAQARSLASKLGIKLGKITNIVEGSVADRRDYGAIPMYAKIQMAGGAGNGPMIEPGSQSVTSVVTLYFEKN